MTRPTRTVTLWECDHLRPVVFAAGSWHHITHDGRVGGECGSHGYRLDVTPDNPRSLDHALHRLQRIGDTSE